MEGGGSTEEAIYLGMSTPPAPYPLIDLERVKPRTIKWKFAKPHEEKPNNKIVKDNSPSPGHYKNEDSYDKTQQTIIRHAFPKAPKKTFTDRDIKKAKLVPGIGSYDVTRSDRVNTLGARRGYK